MSEQGSRAGRTGETGSKSSRAYTEIMQLNQELVANLQGLVDEHEARKQELDELKFSHDQAQAEIARLQEELRHAKQRDSERHEQLRQLEQERVDQLGAMSAHLDAMRAAVERYLQQGRKAAA
jgi:chromosome segregation ATPase